MKKLIYLFLTVLIVACSSDDSATDEFNQANGNVQVKLIQSISIVSAQDSQENKNISFSYTSDGFLNTLSDGIDTSIFVYDDNDDLSNITGGGNDNLNIEELYESPYDAFETGEVILYDNNGNPKKIEFYEVDSQHKDFWFPFFSLILYKQITTHCTFLVPYDLKLIIEYIILIFCKK